jgi:hypothetical protein
LIDGILLQLFAQVLGWLGMDKFWQDAHSLAEIL